MCAASSAVLSNDFQVVDVHNVMVIRAYVMNRNSVAILASLHSGNARAFPCVPPLFVTPSRPTSMADIELIRQNCVSAGLVRVECLDTSAFIVRVFLFPETDIIAPTSTHTHTNTYEIVSIPH